MKNIGSLNFSFTGIGSQVKKLEKIFKYHLIVETFCITVIIERLEIEKKRLHACRIESKDNDVRHHFFAFVAKA